jgi:hypothetical protein
LKDEEAIDWCKRISKLSLDKRNKLKEGHGGSPRKRALCVCGKERKRRMKGEEIFVLMCGEVLKGSMCVRIKHERNLCSKCL